MKNLEKKLKFINILNILIKNYASNVKKTYLSIYKITNIKYDSIKTIYPLSIFCYKG